MERTERRVENFGHRPERRNANLDPISGAPGAHPVGTGLGAAAGGVAAGAAAGTVAGPVGTVVGAAIGAIVGGLAGKGVAESIDPTAEEAYWAENYESEPYYEEGYTFQDYHPAIARVGRHAGGIRAAPSTTSKRICAATTSATADSPAWIGRRTARRPALPGTASRTWSSVRDPRA